MEYRHLGNSGLKISALSFGAWVTFGDQMDTGPASECMDAAHEAGVNFFDNAEVYADGKAETIMGHVLQEKNWDRSEYLVSTKIFWGGQGVNQRGLSRKHILEGTWAALDRLQLDYVDLIFCHRPDPETPMLEVVQSMNRVLDDDLAFYWGTSEWSAEQIRQAYEIARAERLIPPTMEQPQYNMLVRDKVEVEFQPLYRDFGLGTTVWSPLASGLLTGKYDDGIPADSRLALENYGWLSDMVLGEGKDEKLARVRALADVAGDLGCTRAQLALAWCLKNPHVSTVITGASRPEQVVENMKALEVAESLDDKFMERIESILENKPQAPQNWR